MIFKKIASACWRFCRYPLYRKHLVKQIYIQLCNGTIFDWLKLKINAPVFLPRFNGEINGGGLLNKNKIIEELTRLVIEKSELVDRVLPFGVPFSSSGKNSKVAVVVHIYYEKTWPEIAQSIAKINHQFDLIVTTPSEKFALVSNLVRGIFPDVEIFEFENRGRDIRPFICMLPMLIQREYNAVLKIHSKKSLHMSGGDVWRKELINNLIPKSFELDQIVKTIERYPRLGIVAPKGSILSLVNYSSANGAWLGKLSTEIGVDLNVIAEEKYWFPAGSMFWFKPKSLQLLLQCISIRNDCFELESGQLDGTLAHAIERFIGVAVISADYLIVDTSLVKSLDEGG